MKRNRWLTALAAVGIHMSIGSVAVSQRFLFIKKSLHF